MLKLKSFYKKTMQYKEVYKFTNDWMHLLASLGVQNKKVETYTLRNIERIERSDFNGIKCRIQIPFGLLREGLIELKPYIEEAFDCVFECGENVRNNYVSVEFKFI